MGLGNFFRKIGSGIASGAQKAWSGAKYVGGKVLDGAKFIGKAAKPVINVAQKITGLTDKIPGMIGEVSKLVSGGLDTAKKWIDMVPEGSVKKKLEELSGGADDLVKRGEETALRGGKLIGGLSDKASPWIGLAGKIADGLAGTNRPALTGGGMSEAEWSQVRSGIDKQGEYNRKYKL